MAPSRPIAGSHLVRYGIPAEHKFLLGPFLKTYDQLVVNASIASYMPATIASFITQKSGHKPYLIDPQTHAFQHDLTHIEGSTASGKTSIRKSIKSLIERYGEPIKTRVGKNRTPILPQDLADKKVRSRFCEQVLTFQSQALKEVVERSDVAKYYEFLEDRGKISKGRFAPTVVVAPYFFLTGNTFDAWLRVNILCFSDSIPYAADLDAPLAAQIVISRDVLLSNSLRSRLITEYTKPTAPSVYLVWVDSFPEHLASEEELQALIDLLKGLESSAPVVNLYGGFFSIALARARIVKGLIGVTHGLEYAEDRPVVPVGGGLPTAKFYLPNLHTRLAFRNALRAIRRLGGFQDRKSFLEKICDCKECETVIDGKPELDFEKYGRSRAVSFTRRGQITAREFPLTETRERSVRHYMWRKQREYSEPFNLTDLIHDLRKTGKSIGRILGLEGAAHCDVWANVLSKNRV